MLRPLRRDGQPVKLAGQSDSEVADVNHLLHFTLAFGQDLPGLQGYEPPEIALGFAQGVAELADDLTALGSRNELPLLEGRVGAAGGAFVFVRRGSADGGEDATVNRRDESAR